jgi:hypothetical protein
MESFNKPLKPVKRISFIPLLALPFLLYLLFLNRGFVSEDFPLIRILTEHPPWTSWGELFGGSWLGISIVRFYRPVAILLFGIEVQVFGTSPLGYNMVHLFVHLACGLLVFLLLRRILSGSRDWVAWGGALLFLLHPLHPNAVLWPATFATIFGAFFFLLSAWFFLRYRETLNPIRVLASFASFLLALGCYESTIVLPVLLIAADFILRPSKLQGSTPENTPSSTESSVPRRKSLFYRLVPHLVFILITLSYLVLRRAILGEVLGGYSELADRLSVLGFRISGLARSLRLILIPTYGESPGPLVDGIVLFLLLLPLALGIFRIGLRERFWRPALFLWLWTVLNLAPYAFEAPVPANARMIYVASMGPLALALFGLDRLIGRKQSSNTTKGSIWIVGCLLVLTTFLYSMGLWRQMWTQKEASDLACRVVRELEKAELAQSEELLAIAGVPAFVQNSLGTNLAQVFHWGLSDAVMPPFGTLRARVLLLPPTGYKRGPMPLLPDGRPLKRLRWKPSTETFLSSPKLPPQEEIVLLDPSDEAELAWNDPNLDAQFVSLGSHLRYSTVIVTPGVAHVLKSGAQSENNSIKMPFPRRMLQSMAFLYGPGAWWWVEGRDSDGRVVAMSRLRELRIHPEPARPNEPRH